MATGGWKGGKVKKVDSEEDEFGESLVNIMRPYVRYMHLLADEPDLPKHATLNFRTGVVLVGNSGISGRIEEFLHRNSVQKVSRTMHLVELPALLAVFGKAALREPSVLILKEFHRLSSALESEVCKLMKNMCDKANLTVVVAVTADKTYVVPEKLKNYFSLLDLKE